MVHWSMFVTYNEFLITCFRDEKMESGSLEHVCDVG